MMKFLFSLFFFNLFLSAFANGGCGNIFLDEMHNGVSETAIRERFTQLFDSNRRAVGNEADTFLIPVVFNVLYQDSTSDVALFDKSRYQSTIDRANYYLNIMIDSLYAINHPTFHDIIDVPHIKLVIARLDPNGQPTDGFRFKKWTPINGGDMCTFPYVTAQQKVKLDGQGGITGWDSRQYLNFWVGNYHNNASCFGGQSTYPIWPFLYGNPLNFMDGILIQDYYIKNSYTLQNFFPSTMIHELGHYLGLQHIWGGIADDSEKGCNIDDNIKDTPTQYEATYTCNYSYNSCNDGANDKIDMCSNVMDYADGVTYTHDQVSMMRSVLVNARKELPIPALTAYIADTLVNACAGLPFTLQWIDTSAKASDFLIPEWDESGRVLTHTFTVDSDTSFSTYLTNGYDTVYQQIHVHVLESAINYNFPSSISEGDTLHIQVTDAETVSTNIPYSYTNDTFTFVASVATDTFWIYIENDCSVDSFLVSYEIASATGVRNQNIETLILYPNPASEYIRLPNEVMNRIKSISLLSMDVKYFQIQIITNELDISSLASGMYYLSILTEDGILMGKFIKE